MSVFNLTEVCGTVCCLTYTTCSTVHIHSFHKKYIFVYTAFTISYNRVVAGTSVSMFSENFSQCPQNTSDPQSYSNETPSHNYMPHFYIQSRSSPAASSILIGYPAVSLSGFDSPSNLSIHLSGSRPCFVEPHCWFPVMSLQEEVGSTRLFVLCCHRHSLLPLQLPVSY